jgi:hypothetical protein
VCQDSIIVETDFSEATMKADALKIHLPEAPHQWEDIRVKFFSKSEKGIIHGCVGAIDSCFQPMKCPTVKETNGNVGAYFSGHYNHYALNCQALCDSDLHFFLWGYGPGQQVGSTWV